MRAPLLYTPSFIHYSFFPPISNTSRQHVSGKVETKKEEERQRRRRMAREEEKRMRAYIKAAFTGICALGVESPYEYQYEPMERKHSPLFFSSPSHWAIHAHKTSIQAGVMASLCARAWLCEQCCFASTVSLPLPWLWLVLAKKTLYVKCNCSGHYSM